MLTDLDPDIKERFNTAQLTGLTIDVVSFIPPWLDEAEAKRREMVWRDTFRAAGARIGNGWTRLLAPRPQRRDAWGCVENPDQEVLVLIDATDPYDPAQWAALRTTIEKELVVLPPDGVLELHVLTEDAASRQGNPDLRLCAPTDRTQAAADSFLAEAVARVDLTLTEPPQANRTPLMENIAAVFSSRRPTAGKRRILLFTDGLINSEAMPFMENGNVRFDEILERKAVQRVMVDLAGAEMQLLYARRDGQGWGALQNEQHRNFLHAYVAALNARLEPKDFVILDES